jgi:outer membrane receptor protein involved in Fe transport
MKITKCRNRALATAILLAFGGSAWAEDGVNLDKITVKGEGMREADRSFTVNTISRETIGSQRWDNPLDIFEETPGVEVRSIQGGSVGDFVTIRGMTGGGHGGDLGFSLDGISLNEAEGHSDGYADTQIVIPLEIESLTVYKGPVSPLYGNFARGGVMAFQTRKGGEYTDVHLSGGSWGTYDGQLAFGSQIDAPFLGPIQLNAAVQGYESEGWRDNSRFTKMNLAA